jgi:hypothetical protein
MNTLAQTAVLRHLYAYYYPEARRLFTGAIACPRKQWTSLCEVRTTPSRLRSHIGKARPSAKTAGSLHFAAKLKIKNAYLVTKQDTDFGVTQVAGIEDLSGEPTQFLKIPAHILFCICSGRRKAPLRM